MKTDKQIDTLIGQVLKEERTRRGYSMEYVAVKLGVTTDRKINRYNLKKPRNYAVFLCLTVIHLHRFLDFLYHFCITVNKKSRVLPLLDFRP